MKHIISLVAIVAVAVLAACVGFSNSHAAPVKHTPVKHGPILTIDTSASNFGAVPNSGYAKRTFVLRNTGDAPLHITQARPTCGCTVAALADSIIAPGHSTKLNVSLSAAHRSPGNFEKSIYITSNSSAAPSQWLKFYGHYVQASATSAQK
jgi:hypothetical protein